MEKIILQNEYLKVAVLTLGATIQSLQAFGLELAAGFESEEEYLNDTCYFGAVIGRTANRCGGAAVIGENEYTLSLNEKGVNHLHGGNSGFNRKRFEIESQTDSSVTLSCFSPDGEEGYPGNMKAFVTYSLIENSLLINYKALADKPTWVNLTNHTYFNPFGIASGRSALKSMVQINAEQASVYDENNRVIGRAEVKNTELDLRKIKELNRFYDHNYYITPRVYADFGELRLAHAATALGRVKIECFTNSPCVQLYCGEFIPENTRISGGNIIGSGGALCLETQLEPNLQARNEGILNPGEIYNYSTAYRFSK